MTTDPIQQARDVAARGPWHPDIIDGNGEMRGSDGDIYDETELADFANALMDGFTLLDAELEAVHWLHANAALQRIDIAHDYAVCQRKDRDSGEWVDYEGASAVELRRKLEA